MQKSFRTATAFNSLTKPVCAALYLTLVTTGVFYFFRNWAYDDPFITYRYAQNVASGLGFVYNPGEHILSTTTPFFTLLLAAIAPFWNNLPHLANLLGAISIAFGGLLLYYLADTLHEPWVGWAGLLLYPASPLLLSCLGSETPLYIALCLACFVFYWRANYSLAAVFAALAVLTRADGLLVPLLLAADHIFIRRHPIPWRPALLFLGLALPWFVFAWIYFGSPIPATLAAKQHQGLMAISQRFAPGLVTMIKSFFGSRSYAIQAGVAILGIIYANFKRQPNFGIKSRKWFLFFAWPIVYFVAFSALGVTRYFWYYAPLVPGFVALVGLGLACIAGLIRPPLTKLVSPARLASRISITGYVPQFAMLAVFLLLGGLQISHLRTILGHNDPRYAIYKKAGDWLTTHTPPAARVGALEVGIIGYYAQRPMIDFAGLIQPEIASHLEYHTTYADSASFAINRYQPDYLVLREGDFPQLERSYAAQNCQLLERFEGARYQYTQNLAVYDCRKAH